ncbi:flavodoxin family protein [Caldisalinibacter kiritimatiensis]|uniref:Flavodoxin n=1 Tax=Caldisalinibacter kiritimatiensis TaxID=1304284 RepID=R1CB01_9FIRM|nr:flavodoxin family protein [Caldisalinibacter kiritimatiensis]EOC99479.1 Flavodoxin [Caldisalinibacter kiritimatiensis]
MKTLVVYYSLEGNTKLIADTIAEEINCDVLRLRPKKDIPKKGFLKFFLGGMNVVFNKKPELEPYNKNFDKYDLIVFGSPVWAGSYAPSFNTLFSQVSLKDKKIALFSCYGGREGKVFEKFSHKLQGNEVIGQIGFIEPKKNNIDENTDKAKQWIHQLVK